MFRFALLMLLSTSAYALQPVDIDTAATVYQEAAIREQVRASLGAMPAHIRQLFSADAAAHLSDQQLNAVTAAAKRGFRIDVFEVPALSALAANLDADTVKKSEEFLSSDLGRRMVAADIATAKLPEDQINKVMNGEQTVPSTPQRDALLDKLEKASRSTESTVQIFLSMGQAVAIGTAVGSGADTASVAEKARKTGEASRTDMEASMRQPLRRYLAYSYRDMSDADLKHLLKFLESPTGAHYVTAYIASLGAGVDALGRRCGEQLGESLRELAQAQLDVP
ncbi:MAG: hypothetical protein WBF89_04225, partial [Steroidobacteraceae bacterium]